MSALLLQGVKQMPDPQRFDIGTDETGAMKGPPSGTAAFLNMLMAQQRMQDHLDGISNKLDDMETRDNNARLGPRDYVAWCLGGVVAIALIFGGFFFLVGTQTNPVTVAVTTLQQETAKENAELSARIAQNQAQITDLTKLLNGVLVFDAEMKSRYEEREPRK